MRSFGLFVSALTLAACAAAPEPAAPPAPTGAPVTTAAPAASPPALDLSTAEKARTTIYDVLRRGDKDAFRRCVTKRILDRQSSQFDLWYGVWKAAADKGPDAFKKITVTQEDGQFKLDEN